MMRLVMLSTIMRLSPVVGSAAAKLSMHTGDFAGRKVLITGAAGALGRKMVEKFSREGFEVIGTRSPSSLSGTSKEIELVVGSKLRWHGVDVTSPDSVRSLAKDIGPVDVLVHCAGGFRFAKSEDVLDHDVDFLMDTNVKSAMYLVREFIPLMKQRNFGRVIFISSKATLQPGPGLIY
jgi:NAD(P)-dependent dehydrogenase (short-subunit alcohol dehydrogenase family)